MFITIVGGVMLLSMGIRLPICIFPKKVYIIQYLRQKSRRFSMNPADFRGLENPVVD